MKKSKKIIKTLKKILRPGDVINISGHPKFYEFWLHIAYHYIRKTQKEVFGEKSRWTDTHTMMWFDGSAFSVEPPRAKMVPIEDFAFKEISIYRYTKCKFTAADIEIMWEGAKRILDTEYDFGQLLNILINTIAGYPFYEKYKFFDFGAKYKVCSVGVAAIYTYWRHKMEQKGKKIPRLFSKLNPNAWNKEFIKKFKQHGNRWDVENTFPANFANTQTHFDKEFVNILFADKGEILYLLEI